MHTRHIFALLLIYLFCSMPTGAVAAETEKPVMTVTLARAHTGTLQNTIEAHGKAVPRENIVVATDLSGIRVIEVLAEAGDMVTKGQVLARLDKSSLQHDHDVLKADLDKAEAEFRRAWSLRGTGAISQQEAESKKASFLMLRSQVADARLRLTKSDITAPSEGLLYHKNVDAGSLVQPDSVLFSIAAHNEIELEVAIPEAFSHIVTRNMDTEVRLSHMAAPLPARVRLVSPEVDQRTRTISVRLVVAEAPFIPVGAYCVARFLLPAGQGLLVPATAIQRDITGFYVWAVESGGMVSRREVRVLASNTDNALVDGIPEHTDIVARAGSFLQEGDRIRSREAS